MSDLIKICPRCKSARPSNEIYCKETIDNGNACGWHLIHVPPTTPQADDSDSTTTPSEAHWTCRCGHLNSDEDLFCENCGETPEASQAKTEGTPPDSTSLIGKLIEGWKIVESINTRDQSKECYKALRESDQKEGFLNLYQESFEPDTAIYDLLKNTDVDHLPAIEIVGRWTKRPFEIFEWIKGGTLEKADLAFNDFSVVKRITDEMARALRDFSEKGLRHRNITPNGILIRELDPLDLVITNFGSARLSDFDLDAVSPLELTRYSAPEAIVGGVSAASDWWSLGMILLEKVTQGACFEGINDKAFLIHVVTRGISIPDDLDPKIRNLLRGLLLKDPIERWHWEQVSQWLEGKTIDLPEDREQSAAQKQALNLTIGGQNNLPPERFALTAAEEENWEESLKKFQSGEILTAITEVFSGEKLHSAITTIFEETDLTDEWKLSLVLMHCNESLPLIYRGQIVTPAWMLDNHHDGNYILSSKMSAYLEKMERQDWIFKLKFRKEKIIERAKLLEIDLNQENFDIYGLSNSRAALEAERDALREAFPTSTHRGIASLLDKNRINDEDLIALLCAEKHQFTPLTELIKETIALAEKVNQTNVTESFVRDWITRPRREIFNALNERILNFAQHKDSSLNSWAERYRVEGKLPLQRAIVLLSTSENEWEIPKDQEYISNLMNFFEKRVINSVLRGPLVRLTISKTSPKIDMTELGTPLKPSEAILNHILQRTDIPIPIDPQALFTDDLRERRMWRLCNNAYNYTRETGIDSLYLAFPFLLLQDRGSSSPPKIIPILLWPVQISHQYSNRGSVNICFDKDREEVRLNPALPGLLDERTFKKFKQVRSEILSKDQLTIEKILHEFGTCQKVRHFNLHKHPKTSELELSEKSEIEASAVLFNAFFTGQAISEDIKKLKNQQLRNTSLEPLLRIDGVGSKDQSHEDSCETERFTVADLDPSQDLAVLKSQIPPGLVVEGPPGTGKSQTIVNIISEAIGRKETVLVVCQKQAALRIVEKRLESKKLSHRIIRVNDINKDRQQIIRTVRDQIENLYNFNNQDFRDLQQKRKVLANRIEHAEKELNLFHSSIYKNDELSGFSYRKILSELIKIEHSSHDKYFDIPQLRTFLSNMDYPSLVNIQGQIFDLTNDWHHSNYEKSSLISFKQFSADQATIEEIRSITKKLLEYEESRKEIWNTADSEFERKSIPSLKEWLSNYKNLFKALNKTQINQVKDWFLLFFDEVNEISIGEDQLNTLKQIVTSLSSLNVHNHHDMFFDYSFNLSEKEVRRLKKYLVSIMGPITLFKKLNPFYYLRKNHVNKIFTSLHEEATESNCQKFSDSCELELKLKVLRKKLEAPFLSLGVKYHQGHALTIKYLNTFVNEITAQIEEIIPVFKASKDFPEKSEIVSVLKSGEQPTYDNFLEKIDSTILLDSFRGKSLTTLSSLSPWIEDEWLREESEIINENGFLINELNQILGDITCLIPFQNFRLRSKNSDKDIFPVFRFLRDNQDNFNAIPDAVLPDIIQNIIQREAFLGWKHRIEEQTPILTLAPELISQKIKDLKKNLTEIKKINQRLLVSDIKKEEIGSHNQWEDITRLRGPRYKKLREFIDLGEDIGLMKVRPIWLMNPDVASQCLPLKAGLFDLVVFDEASQIMVDFSIPSLFRAKRVVISGDEKQMPPSSFFTSSVEIDEDDLFEEPDEDASEAELNQYQAAWNRREVKDCPDLLALGKSALPTSILQIHYRSQYRPLIQFSNFSFYSGNLSVPALHPLEEILKIQPIEFHSVMGIYKDQTNEKEADFVTQKVYEILKVPRENRPSTGVVTFNLKQAELIEDKFLELLENHPDISQEYQWEKNRTQNGEDMGLFVKNVENVQGDERDLIIFSTTFGKNQHGSFRRNFGVLGHLGGERRLNVAVTRARKKTIIACSMPIQDISDMLSLGRKPNKSRDYIQSYLDYGQRVSSGDIQKAYKSLGRSLINKPIDLSEQIDQDGFLESVENFLKKMGWVPVKPPPESGVFNVDLAIVNPRTNLFGIGIECDGPNHPILKKARFREIWRYEVFHRSIPVLHRISCFDWYQNRKQQEDILVKIIKTALMET